LPEEKIPGTRVAQEGNAMNSKTLRIRRPNQGFSLIEVLTVMAVIGILAAMAIPQVLAYMKNYQIKAAQQQVLSEVQTARNRAIGKNLRFGVVFVPLSASTYQYVFEDDVVPPFDGAVTAAAVSTRQGQVGQAGPVSVGRRMGARSPRTARDSVSGVSAPGVRRGRTPRRVPPSTSVFPCWTTTRSVGPRSACGNRTRASSATS
jgi:prepilin-type N-terminal cleavage/methylation domain-containing protein